jgi:SAM-dependent methyltransferase
LVSGQDISEPAVAEARAAMARHGVEGTFRVGAATSLVFDDGSFDAVFSGDFLEHITRDEKRAFLAEVFRVLRPGGILVIKTPNLNYLRVSTIVRRLSAILRGRWPMSIHIEHTRGNPDYQHHGLTTYAALKALLREQLFHSPEFVRQPLSKGPLPRFLQELLPTLPLVWSIFNRDLIIACRKAICYGQFP